MKTFTNQPDLTAYWESFSAKAYRCPAGIWTIGYGSTFIHGFPVKKGMTVTQQLATQLLIKDFNAKVFDLEDIVNENYPSYVYEAVADYTFNGGIGICPALIGRLKSNDLANAAVEFLDGFKAADPNTKKKVPLLGLLLRRISNYNTFLTGKYVAWEKGDSITPALKSLLLLKNGHNDAAVAMINKLKGK